jgi:lambda family phage portal protein
MNNLDKIIGYFSPNLLQKRLKNRQLSAIYQDGKRRFEGATRGRRGAAMVNSQGNVNSSLLGDISLLRARSIDLYDNNPYAKKAVRTIVFSVVGNGIQIATKGGTPAQNEAVKLSFNSWAKSKACDFYGRKNFYAIQKQIMQTVAISGSCLVIKRRSANGIQLQVFNADSLDTSQNSLLGTNNGNFITNGIEFDKDGRRVAYHIYKELPQNRNALTLDSQRIEASEVLHIYEEDILGRVEGVPFLAAAMLRFSDLDGYEDAQLVRQKIAACYAAFVTSQPNASDFQSQPEEDLTEKVEPGIIQRLAPGDQITFGSPPPAEGYSEYTTKVQQGMAAGMGITYEQLSGDLSGVNFSSGRMGWIEAQKQIEDWQYNLMIEDFCKPVFQWFLEVLEIKGLQTDSIESEWTPRGRVMIDPAKEIKAKIAQLQSGIKSWSEIVRENGNNPDSLLEEMKEERTKLEALGLDWMPKPEPVAE